MAVLSWQPLPHAPVHAVQPPPPAASGLAAGDGPGGPPRHLEPQSKVNTTDSCTVTTGRVLHECVAEEEEDTAADHLLVGIHQSPHNVHLLSFVVPKCVWVSGSVEMGDEDWEIKGVETGGEKRGRGAVYIQQMCTNV